MDFKSIIEAEVEAKRRKVNELKESKNVKYIKRGDLEKTVEEVEQSDQQPSLSQPPSLSYQELSQENEQEPEILQDQSEKESLIVTSVEEEEEVSLQPQESPTMSKSKEEPPRISAMETEVINSKANLTDISPIIALFLRRLRYEQKTWLLERPEEEKSSKEGKLATVLFQQSYESLTYLFKLIKKSKVPQDVLKRLAEICSFMQQREYIKANDSYLKLAIGNAPWPIGVTAVGIHERSAQERIKSNQIAHVLNDETARKWLQAVKRLMTFCQTKYPPKQRSKMVFHITPQIFY